mmetsp:Transcript_70242/g.222714  ORF Transcript_70242/g.222714 Transcript_70242/m.222714 type:complete len:872 (-) Transcript_70242:72-2687(-)
MIMNLVLSAYLLGNMTVLLTQSDESTQAYRKEVGAVEKYMKYNDFPYELRHEIRLHFQVQYEQREEHSEIVDKLTPALRLRVLRHQFDGVLKRSPLLHKCSRYFLDALLIRLTADTFSPGQRIAREGDAPNELYWVVSGLVEAVVVHHHREEGSEGGSQRGSQLPRESGGNPTEEGSEIRVEKGSGHRPSITDSYAGDQSKDYELPVYKLFPADSFGEHAFLANVSHQLAFVATRHTRVFVLSREDYEVLKERYPRDVRALKKNALDFSMAVTKEVTEANDVAIEEHEKRIDELKEMLESFSEGSNMLGRLSTGIRRTSSIAAVAGIANVIKKKVKEVKSSNGNGFGSAGDASAGGEGTSIRLPRPSMDKMRRGKSIDLSSLSRPTPSKDESRVEARLANAVAAFDGVPLPLHMMPRPKGSFGSKSLKKSIASIAAVDTTVPEHTDDGELDELKELVALYRRATSIVTEAEETLRLLVNKHKSEAVELLAGFCRAGSLGEVRNVIHNDPSLINMISEGDNGKTPLHCAVSAGHVGIVKFLLSKGGNPNVVDRNGVSPLLEAARTPHEEIMNVLHENNAQLCLLLQKKTHTSSSRNSLTGVFKRLNDVPGRLIPGWLEFLHNVQIGRTAYLQRLLSVGMDPDDADMSGRTALHIACAQGNPQIVELLLKYGSHPNKFDAFGRTPTLEAVENGSNRCTTLILAAGGVLGLKKTRFDGNNRPYLILSSSAHWATVAKHFGLSTATSNPHAAREEFNTLAQVIAARKLEHLRLMLRAGADARACNFDHRTLLHLSCLLGSSDMSSLLVQWGADPFAKDSMGRTPLDEARAQGFPRLADSLVAKKASLEEERAMRQPAGGGAESFPLNSSSFHLVI